MKIKNQAFKNNQKGFTLTELIIVIVIIGILAAVLIPYMLNYIERARLSNDESDVRNINMLLKTNAIETDTSYYLAPGLIEFINQNGYDLVARSKDYYYWYDYHLNQVVLKTDQEVYLENYGRDHLILATPDGLIRHLTDESLLYIDQGKSDRSLVINQMTNILATSLNNAPSNNPTDVNPQIDLIIDSLIPQMTGLNQTLLTSFKVDQTLYLTDDFYYTDSDGDINIKRIVFDNDMVLLPDTSLLTKINVEEIIYIPRMVEPISLKNSNLFTVISGLNDQIIKVVVTKTEQAQALLSLNNPKLEVVIENQNVYHTHQVTFINISYLESKVGKIESLVIPTNGTFQINFSSDLVKPGSLIKVTNLEDQGGYRYYDLRIYDQKGTLYGRGVRYYQYQS